MAQDSKDSTPAPFYRRVSEIIRDPSEWKDFEQVDFDLLDGSEIVIHDVMFLRGDYDRADPDYAIILFGRPDEPTDPDAWAGRHWPATPRTSACGGAVLVKKLKRLAAYGPEYEGQPSALPILGRVVLRQGTRYAKPYQDFI